MSEPEKYTREVDAAEIFGFSKATITDMGEQPFPEGFDELSGSLGHLWLIRHDELHEYSSEGIWYLPKNLELYADVTSPFARLAADHSTLYPVSPEEVAPYIGGFTPPEKDGAPATTTEENGSAADPISQPEKLQEAAKLIPVRLSIPVTRWEYAEVDLSPDGPHGEPQLVINGRGRDPGYEFEGHPVWCLPIQAVEGDPDGLIERWRLVCQKPHREELEAAS